MAAESDVIKQFLVSLGFQLDQTGLRRFLGGLNQTNKAAMAVGKTVIGVAVAAEAMVIQFSSSMEKLYYSSKRTKSSVQNLQTLEFGSRQIGLAAGQAREALESMTAAARTNPGLRGLMDGLLGKSTAGLDQAEVMLELVQKLSSMPHYVGSQYAAMFGMDEKTFLMLKDGMPELLKAEQERRELNKRAGIDAQAAAEAGKEYANSIREITERAGVLRDRLAIDLLPTFRSFNDVLITSLDYWSQFKLDDHPDAKAAVEAVQTMGPAESLGEMSKGNYWEAIKGMVRNSPGGVLARKGFDSLNDWRDSYRPGGSRSANPAPTVPEQTPVMPPVTTAPPPKGGRLPLGLRQNNPGNLRSWGNAPVQNGFATFNSPGDGLNAMAGNILAYYNKHGLNTVRSIVARWAPSNENNTGAYVDAISKRLGVGENDKLDLKDPAILSRMMGAMIQHEQGYNPYGSAELMTAAQNRLGGATVGAGKQVVINQKTDIHVSGGDSPQATGRAIGAVQDETNGNMVRNMQGAIR